MNLAFERLVIVAGENDKDGPDHTGYNRGLGVVELLVRRTSKPMVTHEGRADAATAEGLS